MFFSSINNRLWLTYLFIVIFVILIAFSGIAVAFRDSPMLYRQTFYRISLVNGFLKERLPFVIDNQWESFISLFLEEVKVFDVNVSIYDSRGIILYSNEENGTVQIPDFEIPLMNEDQTKDRIYLFKDQNKRILFYQISKINSKYYLVTSAIRPDISISSVFQDELMKPLIRAGLTALFLSFILGWFISRWITHPLKKIALSASQIAEGNYVDIPVEGPLEVQQMGIAINNMVTKVKRSLQSQKDFVANVSHEFKTPLTSIQGFAQALFDGAIINKKDKKHAAGIILEETERLNRLVGDLLTLAKLDAGMIVMEMSKVDLNQIIINNLEKLQFQIKAAEISIEKFLEDTIILSIDAEKISQVVNNLIDNAVKFSPERSNIEIITKKEGKFAVLQISDSGPGIPKSDQARIFERFYQVDKSRKGGRGRGVGLGLSIAKQIIDAHNGQISVQSKEGAGSTFMVKLPLNDDTK